jgi:hypothetical protein
MRENLVLIFIVENGKPGTSLKTIKARDTQIEIMHHSFPG